MVNTTAPSFAWGLTGVRVSVDNLSRYVPPAHSLPFASYANIFYSHILWGTIAVLFLIILIIKLLHHANAHIRHLTSMGSWLEQDTYWAQERGTFWPALKEKLLYAPLNKKRHNREIQLSKAINVGTLPSRLHALILGLYLTSNIIYCCLLDYSVSNRESLIAEVRGRTGHLAVVNMVGLFVLAGRNNPLIWILGVSFDTFNLFHRWIGRIVALESIAHTIAWSVNAHAEKGNDGVNELIQTDAFIQWGLVATIAISLILIQSPGAVRHAFYEVFLHVHQFLAAAALLGVYVHAKLGPLPQMPYVIAIACIWFYDRIFRFARLTYRNVSFRHGLTKATVEALPGDACRVTFFLPRPWIYKAGTHAYVYFPSISGLQSHPFSIAWSSTATTAPVSTDMEMLPMTKQDLSIPQPAHSISFIMAKRTGMTGNLYDRAAACPSRKLNLTGLVEGPYGEPASLHSYGTVILFAGGVGITHQIGQLRALLSAHDAGTTAVRRITLVWTVRSTEQLDWVRPWMNEIFAMPGRREVLNLQMYVTKPNNMNEVRSASESVKMFPGRPKAALILKEQFDRRMGAMCVGICGPGALADDVRAGVRGLDLRKGVVDFWEESFTW